MERKVEVFTTNSFEETKKLGEKFAENIMRRHPSGAALNISLYGDLGSGKTTFVQGMAKGLGIKRRIISPTFVIVRSYVLKNQKYNSKFKSLEPRSFYHIDLYRIDSEKDIIGLGIEEIIRDPLNIVAIEWAEKMGRFLPRKRWDVRFEYVGGDKRKIEIKNLKTQIANLKTTAYISKL